MFISTQNRNKYRCFWLCKPQCGLQTHKMGTKMSDCIILTPHRTWQRHKIFICSCNRWCFQIRNFFDWDEPLKQNALENWAVQNLVPTLQPLKMFYLNYHSTYALHLWFLQVKHSLSRTFLAGSAFGTQHNMNIIAFIWQMLGTRRSNPFLRCSRNWNQPRSCCY